MSNFLVVVECILEYQNKILVITRPMGVHAEGLLAFPGGKVEYIDGSNDKDILIEAIKREVFEEVGLNIVDKIQFVTSSYFIDAHQNQALDVIFYCKLEKTFVEVNASKREVPEYQWLTYSEIDKHPQAPPWLKRYLSYIYN